MAQAEMEMESLSICLDSVISACTNMVRKGNEFGQAATEFLSSLALVSTHAAFRSDPLVTKVMGCLLSTLSDLEVMRAQVVEQVLKSLTARNAVPNILL